MRRSVQALLLISLGGTILHATVLTDLYLRYVKETLRIPLIISAVLLVVLGLAGVPAIRRLASLRQRTEPTEAGHPPDDGDHGAEHSHDHAGGPRAGWLLFIPTVMLFVFAPPALGSYTAAKDTRQATVEPTKEQTFPRTGTIPLTMTEFTGRFAWDEMEPLRGRVVRLAGFVTPAENGRWYLSRLVVNCCAADANAVKVQIRGANPPPADTWVTVTGVWHPTESHGWDSVPVLDVRAVREIPAPTDPYRDTVP
jgi:uncharacterized repeat protein (TIGR03943 family)